MTFLKTKIRELRENRNMSQKELGDLIGISRQSINYIELGKTSPKITVALKIAKIFNVSVEDIFILEEE
ncbi:MAG: helix-turn-helix transcriptional regulator [Promethearchaeota archaeon]